MTVVLYRMSISHPSQVARKMLDLKDLGYELVEVVPLNQRIHLRLAGSFPPFLDPDWLEPVRSAPRA